MTNGGDAAALLLEARRTRRWLAELPPEVRPRDAAEAYGVQDAVARRLGPIAGWKVGAKGPALEPTCAPIFAVHASPAALPAADFRLFGIEAEIAVRMGRDLPPREAPYSAEDVLAAVESVHAAIEIVESRFIDFRVVDPPSVLADFQSHGGFVLGGGRPFDGALDQARQRCELFVDGEVVCSGVGGNPAGDLVRLLQWLANHVAARAGGLRAGAVVTTGSLTGMRFVAPGAKVEARLPGIGDAIVQFG